MASSDKRNSVGRAPGPKGAPASAGMANGLGEPLEHLVQVAEVHLAADDTKAALEALLRAETAADTDGRGQIDRAGLKIRMADCLRSRGEFTAALEQIGKAIRLLRDHEDSALYARALARAASIQARMGDYPRALESGRGAYDLLRATDEHAEIGTLELTLGLIHMRLGRMRESQEFFENALFTFRRIQHREGAAKALNNLGLLLKNGPRWKDALDYLRQTLAISEQLGHSLNVAWHCINLGILLTKLCEWSEAERLLSRGLTTCREVGNDLGAACGHLARGNLHRRRGRIDDAAADYAAARRLCDQQGYGRESVLCWEVEGELAADGGRLAEAREKLERGLELAIKVAPRGDLGPEIERRLAMVVLRLGDIAEAEQFATRSYRGARQIGDAVEAGASLRVLGEAYLQQGKLKSAGRVLQRAVEVLVQTPEQLELALARLELGRCLARAELEAPAGAGERARAVELIQKSLDFFLSADLAGPAAEALTELAELRVTQDDETAARDVARARGLAERAHRTALLARLERIDLTIESRSTRAELVSSPESQVIELWSRFFARGGADPERLTAMLRFAADRLEGQRAWLAAPAPGGRLAVAAVSEMEPAEADEILGVVLPHLIDRVPVLSGDPAQDGRFAAASHGPLGCARSLVAMALDLPDGRGVLYIDRCTDARPFERAELRVLSVLAGLLALALVQIRRGRSSGGAAHAYELEERTGPLGAYVTQDPGILRQFAQLERVADSSASIVLFGETGTGKGLVAECIHRLSARRNGPFISINCAAIPESLLESELFGHVAGAFTGAQADKRGLFEEAEGGTLFLDEISRASLAVQAKLLHALDTHRIRRVGATVTRDVDVRILCASHADLQAGIRRGTFLEDLFYRLADFTVQLTPLRERPGEIPLLVDHFARRIAGEQGRSPAEYTADLHERLLRHDWPGNIREVIQVVRRLAALSLEGETVAADLLPSTFFGPDEACEMTPAAGFGPRSIASPASPAVSGNGKPRPLREEVLRLERRLISECLQATGWNRAETARRLRISYPTLLAKIRIFGLRQSH